jgi:erythromycin esterase-like protein
MSKNSAKQRVAHLTEWMKTLKSKRSKPVKRGNTQPRFVDYDVKIKNGSNGRR